MNPQARPVTTRAASDSSTCARTLSPSHSPQPSPSGHDTAPRPGTPEPDGQQAAGHDPSRRSWIASICLAGAAWPSLPAAAAASGSWTLDLSAHQRADGALCMLPGSDWVDPYFALKALLLARTFGADLGPVWPLFARYVTAIQGADGLIPRELGQVAASAARSQSLFKRQKSAVAFPARSQADADDALLALWLQAGSLLPAPSAVPASTMQESQLRAAVMLQGPLWNATLGLTRVFQRQETYLLIDNLEVWNAVQQLARRSPWVSLAAMRRRLPSAQDWAGLERRLQLGITQQFQGLQTISPAWCVPAAPWQARLYPDGTVAPLWWLAQRGPSPAPSATPTTRLAAWYSQYRDAWQASIQGEYPWGLLALAAWMEGQRPIAESWVRQAPAARAQGRWHILEEVVLQVLTRLLGRSGEGAPAAGGEDDETLPLTVFGDDAMKAS